MMWFFAIDVLGNNTEGVMFRLCACCFLVEIVFSRFFAGFLLKRTMISFQKKASDQK